MIIYFKILFLISVIFPFNIDNTQNEYYDNNNPNGFNKKMATSNKFDSQIIDQHIDESTYIIGSGDVFLFNMITTNGVITLDLTVSPSGDVLIPIVGKVNLLGKTLLDSYQIINDKCKEKYEDAYVYVNLIKLRQFKVLVTGETTEAGMHIVTANNRVSDLFESIFTFSHIDTILSYHIQDYPKNIMINKDITLIRDNKEIPVNLFDYYYNGKKENNPILLEQDIISLRNTNKITIIGAVEKQIRVQNQSNITYKDLINLSGINPTKGEMDKIKFLNSSSISSLYLNEKNRISNIDPKYRSDTDESFLSARNKTLNGIIYINDKEKLANFLDQSPIDGDILIVPQKSNWVEILGGVQNPGTYLYENNKQIYDYILNAGGYNNFSKDLFVLDVNSGTRKKINKFYIPNPGDIIFVEEKIGYKRWDRIKDIISISASISSVLLVLNNVLGAINMVKKTEIDLSKISKSIKRNSKNIFYTTLVGFVLSFIYVIIATPYYQSYISINPIGDNINSGRSMGGLQSLASEYGVNLNVADFINDKPSFYIPDIVNSRILKKAVISNKWNTNNGQVDLINYWQINDTTKFSIGKLIGSFLESEDNKNIKLKFMDAAIDRLSEQLLVHEEESGLIVISVLMEESQLAADISNFIANYIKKYVSDIMLSYSSTHRAFIEERLKYSKNELSKSEEELKEFSEKNPFAVDTPELQLQRGRLLRNMEVNQQVYITLRQQYEMARINELKEIPVINILDDAEPASDEAKPQKLLIIFLVTLLSLILSSVYVIIKDEIDS